MVFKTIYLILVSMMAIGAIGFFIRAMPGALFVIRKRFGQGARQRKGNAARTLFSIESLNISLFNYQAVRFSFLGLWLTLITVLKITGGLSSFGLQLLLIAVFFIVSIPKNKIGRIKLPF
ncbi:MAG: hypothetical protein R6U35_03850, partial [Candidatus Humimicrobiaceae bacterium]